jgi:5-deoxy-5-amino-3-dehydroquinate synthase
VEQVDELLARFGLETRLKEFDTEEILSYMARDKKAHHDLTFVLDGPRGVEVVSGVDVEVVRATLEAMKGER